MKLASLRGGRDGRLAVVSGDLRRAALVPDVAPTLQAALDDWSAVEPELARAARALEAAELSGVFPFDATACAAPLPRAHQWADGSAYLNHVELVRRARDAPVPASLRREPLIYQGASDVLLGPREDIAVESESWGIDFEGEVAVVTDDVPCATPAEAAADHVKLVMLVNDVSLRHLIPAELEKGFGFFQSKPASSFSPVAVTPDELGPAWEGAKVHLPLLSWYNDAPFGRPDAGCDMAFSFADLIAHAARTRTLGAGTIIGSGTVSNRSASLDGALLAEGGVGCSCIAELRMIETLRHGAPRTTFMAFGDRVRLEMLHHDGPSVFGAIDQRVVRFTLRG
ncbi:MAG: fumarylacetoacetate hydrolase family protein [Pseudomonadota bacterium]